MKKVDPIRRMIQVALSGICGLTMLVAASARAQVAPLGEKTMGEPAQERLPQALDHVHIEQRLDQQLPLDLPFVDESGKQVKLGEYFGHRPAILALVYYKCPILCSEELKGLTGALMMLKFTPGKDYNVVVVSFDPSEGPALARANKARYLKLYGRPGTGDGWHFLTGPASSITALTKAVGFGYARAPGPDGKLNQFAHASSIQIITPEGRIAQYYLGVEYSPNDLRLGLVEASNHKIGSVVDNIITYCYRYDPTSNRHSLIVVRVIQAGCLLFAFGLGGFLMVNFRRDIKQAAEMRAASTHTDKG